MGDAGQRILLIENCDFRRFPPGGQLSFARNLIRAFGDRLALVGAATNGDPVGRWVEAEFEGHRLPFLAAGRLDPAAVRPWMPARLRFWLQLRRYRGRILALEARHAIALAPETMMAVRDWGLQVCYHFSGTDNPLRHSRYRWARPLARWFDAVHFSSASEAALLLAHADQQAIDALAERARGKLRRGQLHFFPTCVDLELFRPRPQQQARAILGLPQGLPVFVTVGRITQVKGWDLLLSALASFRSRQAPALLCFIGDGEDRARLEARAAAMGLNGAVRVAGFQPRERVALWLNAADAVLFGSWREGWSNAMLEALASGRPLVATRVSGSREMIEEGVNGFLVPERDPGAFADAMRAALELPEAEAASVRIATRYSLSRIADEFRALWSPLKQACASDGPPAARILGVRIQSVGMREVIRRVLEWARAGQSRSVCFATVYGVMLARDSQPYRKALSGADLVVPDGAPLAWGLRRLGLAEARRVAGPDLVPLLLKAAEREGVPVGFYGARPEVLEGLLERVRARWPRLLIPYAWSPPFRPLNPSEDAMVARQIRESGARILFVGLGTPKQDLWMAAHRDAIPAVMLGVGQAFDLLAGTQRRAPRWMQRWGLEWLFRLMMEPRRLWRRYLPHNLRFLALFARQSVALGRSPGATVGSAGD